MTRPQAFIYRPGPRYRDAVAVVYNCEGRELGCWISSSVDFAMQDCMRFVPAGYEVVRVLSREAMQALIDAGTIRNLRFEPADDFVSPG